MSELIVMTKVRPGDRIRPLPDAPLKQDPLPLGYYRVEEARLHFQWTHDGEDHSEGCEGCGTLVVGQMVKLEGVEEEYFTGSKKLVVTQIPVPERAIQAIMRRRERQSQMIMANYSNPQPLRGKDGKEH
ncbi:hypothetical protein ACFL06_02100 [Patescibacteria group bacterium]